MKLIFSFSAFQLFSFCLFLGCAVPAPGPAPTPFPTNDVPNLSAVDPAAAIYRGAQPRGLNAWQYLHTIGVSNVIKLDTPEQGDDSLAELIGMTVHRHPIDTTQELVTGPDPADFTAAVREIKPGTFIHCEHGQDRTGLLIGQYRLTQGTNKPAAYQEMLDHGFHPALLGLQRYWDGL